MKGECRSEVSRWFRAWMIAIVIGAFAGSAPLYAQGAKVSSPAELARAADALKPGEWVWAPSVAPTGPVLSTSISLASAPLSTATECASPSAPSLRVSPGIETPTGVFTILQKDASHRSKKYNNAPMPYQERLTWNRVCSTQAACPDIPRATDAYTFLTPFRRSSSASPPPAPPRCGGRRCRQSHHHNRRQPACAHECQGTESNATAPGNPETFAGKPANPRRWQTPGSKQPADRGSAQRGRDWP